MKRKSPADSLSLKEQNPTQSFRTDTDYRIAPTFSDLEIKCSDGGTLLYFKEQLAKLGTTLTEQLTKTPDPPWSAVQFELPYATSTVNCLLNWLDLDRVAFLRLTWLRSKDLALLLDLGRLAHQFASTELFRGCVEAVTILPSTARARAEDLVLFASETKTPLRKLAESSLGLLNPAKLPEWPQEIWAALLESKATTADHRLAKMAITIHADIPPDPALRISVALDVLGAAQDRPSLNFPSKAGLYWNVMISGRNRPNSARNQPNRARNCWMLTLLGYFMFGADVYLTEPQPKPAAVGLQPEPPDWP